MSPLARVLAAAGPAADIAQEAWYQNPVYIYSLLAGLATIALNGLAIWKIRVWNPSREIRPVLRDEAAEHHSIWDHEADLNQADREARAEQARQQHVDARRNTTQRRTTARSGRIRFSGARSAPGRTAAR